MRLLQKKLKIVPTDYLLILGAILAPMTGFRIWKIGPAEVLCFFWFLLNIKLFRNIKLSDYFVSFWILFLSAVLLGTVFGIFFYPNEVIALDYFTWLFLGAISIGLYDSIKNHTLFYIETLIKRICIGASYWYLFLWIYSFRVSSTFFGAPLWYGGIRFSGGATNPHQVAIIFLMTTFFMLRSLLKKNEKRYAKLIYINCIIISTFLLFETRSSTSLMALAAAIFLHFICEVIHLTKNKKTQRAIIFFVIWIFIITALFFGHVLVRKFNEWVASDPNGEGRYELFSYIGNAFVKSPFVGLGPGTHSNNGGSEFHNTYLDIISMTGIFGTLVFSVFSFKLFINTYLYQYRLLPLIFSMYVYGFAGFSARRLVYWISISIAMAVVTKYKGYRKIYESIPDNIHLH